MSERYTFHHKDVTWGSEGEKGRKRGRWERERERCKRRGTEKEKNSGEGEKKGGKKRQGGW